MIDIPYLEIDKYRKGMDKQFNPFFNQTAGQVNGLLSSGAMAAEFGTDMAEEIRHYKDMTFNQAETMVGGIPSYGGVSNLRKDVEAINPDHAGKGLIGKGVMAGASTGAAIGTAVPVIGNIAGAVGGAIIGAATGIFGKQRAKNKAEDAKLRGEQTLAASQDKYNTGVENYFDDVDETRGQLQGERNYQSRVFGATINDPFRSII